MSDNPDVCKDCGKVLGTLEKLATIFMSTRRCFDCDLKQSKIEEQQREQEHARQKAIDEQAAQAKEATRQQALEWVLAGNLPIIETPLHLKPDEICHFCTRVALIQEKIVGRKLRGSSQGVSIRVTKRMRYHAGDSGGVSLPIVEVVQADSGDFYITSQRCVFAGVRNTVNMPHSKLVSFKPYSDGIQLNLESSAKTQMFRFEDAEIATAVLSVAVQKSLADQSRKTSRSDSRATKPSLTLRATESKNDEQTFLSRCTDSERDYFERIFQFLKISCRVPPHTERWG